jgi:hypothetical protein
MQATWIVTITRLDGKQREPYEERKGRAPNHGEIFIGTADGEQVNVQIIHIHKGKDATPKARTDFLGAWEVTAREIAG